MSMKLHIPHDIREKLSRRIRGKIVRKYRYKQFYPYLYRSFWHWKLCPHPQGNQQQAAYYTARPNPGAGIGHQLANWMAGYYYAQYFGIPYVHYPFKDSSWEQFFGFGEGEKQVQELKKQGYALRHLPMFDLEDDQEVALNRKIIDSYRSKKVILIAEQDQFLRNLPLVMAAIQQKFYHASSRKEDHVSYQKDAFNIAIHVRRGDIMIDPADPNMQKRYLSNDYFEKVLQTVIDCLPDKKIAIYLFSQGKKEDFEEFNHFENLHWCLDMDVRETFLHFINADLLITSKSSFSYKPALLNKGIKVCPRVFWHDYPQSNDWILAENDGSITAEELQKFKLL
jgi:hypothetical protein